MTRRLLFALALLLLPLDACTKADISLPDGGSMDGGNRTTDGGSIDGGVLTPMADDLVFTEIYVNVPGTETDGEFIELHNPSASVAYQLEGCDLSDTGMMTPHTIVGSLIIGPGEYITLAAFSLMSEGGFVPDYTYGGVLQFANGSDGTTGITCGGTLIDEIFYLSGGSTEGSTRSLDPDFMDATDNDNDANWCDGTGEFTTITTPPGLGTPGAPNPQCP